MARPQTKLNLNLHDSDFLCLYMDKPRETLETLTTEMQISCGFRMSQSTPTDTASLHNTCIYMCIYIYIYIYITIHIYTHKHLQLMNIHASLYSMHIVCTSCIWIALYTSTRIHEYWLYYSFLTALIHQPSAARPNLKTLDQKANPKP